MAAPHIRDLNLPDWHEVPQNATIPEGARYICIFPDSTGIISTAVYDYSAPNRNPDYRYFTPEPIPDPREGETEAEAQRLWRVAFPKRGAWTHIPEGDRDGFRRLAADSLDRNKEN